MAHPTDAIVLILVQAVLIAVLLIQRERRRRTEEVLRESEAKYRRLYEGMIDAFVRVDTTGKIIESNEAYHNLVGYKPDELLNLAYDNLTPDKWHASEAEIIKRQVVTRGYSDIYEKEYRRKDGTVVPVELRRHLIRDESGRACGMWSIVHDITERKRAQEALHKAEEEYRNIFNRALEGIYRVSPQGQILAANPALARMLGFGSAQQLESLIVNSGAQELLDPGDASALAKLLAENGTVRRYECQVKRKDGTTIWVSANIRSVYAPAGQLLYYEGFIEDITDRKRTEATLREEADFDDLITEILSRLATCSVSEFDASVEAALRGTAEFIGADHAYVVRFSAARTSWSLTHEWCGLTVKPKIQELQTMPVETAPHVASRLLAGEVVKVNLPEDYPQDAVEERRYQREEGHLSCLAVPIRTETGIHGCIGLHSHAQLTIWSEGDVAHLRMVGDVVATALERKQTLEDLGKSEEKFSKAFHGSPVAMIIASVARGRCIDVNKAFEENTGYSREVIIGCTAEELGTYLGPGGFGRTKGTRAVESHLRSQEVQYQTSAGDLRVALLSTEMIEVGGEPCILQVFEDITDRKRAETTRREIGLRILMAQEEERRRVARELHDDFSQRLALLAIDLEELAQKPPTAQHQWAGRLHSMWAHTQELTTDIHRLSRQLHPSKLEDLGLVMAVRSYCHEVSQQTKLKVEFLHKGVPQVLPQALSLCLYRIVQETLRNVVKHSGSKDAVVELSGGPEEIQLSITDSGTGFDVDAFNGNEGIGLVSMRERARYVGGQLSIQRRPSGGTRVEARIPLAARSHARALAAVEVSSGAKDL